MPVAHVARRAMDSVTRPAWSRVTAAGIFRIDADHSRFDRHYHDCDEYWLIFAGKARVLTDGEEHDVGPGDIVCTETGVEHDVVEVYGALEAFFFEAELRPGGTAGHLHRNPALASGHDVPILPVPPGFPRAAQP